MIDEQTAESYIETLRSGGSLTTEQHQQLLAFRVMRLRRKVRLGRRAIRPVANASPP